MCLVGAVLECIARSGWPRWGSGDLTYLSKMPVEVKQLRPVGRTWLGERPATNPVFFP